MSLNIESHEFDSEYYLQTYPDLEILIKSRGDDQHHDILFSHFLHHGIQEGRKYRLKNVDPVRDLDHPRDREHRKIIKLIKRFRDTHPKLKTGGVRDVGAVGDGQAPK